MSKTFKDVNIGDKVYVISIQDSKFERKDGEPVMKAYVVTRKRNENFGYNTGNRKYSIVMDNSNVFFPVEDESSSVFNNSYDTTGFNKINSTIYGADKRACIERAISMIRESYHKQEESVKKLEEIIKSNDKMVEFLNEELETADFPDTVLEFAEMALA